MITPSSLDDAVGRLANEFSGQLLQSKDPGYDEARKVHNGLIDKRPKIIARCRDTSDIVAALNLARQRGLEVAVRGGGHNVAGRAVVDDGLMIDLSLMKAIAVDPKARTARAEPGVTWGEFNQATHAHGLATTGGAISTTGIAGLTLGGGIGYLMGVHGLTVDNLLAVEIVTADGRELTASERENPDLFWAVRGGGGNFGVVSSFEYRLHPVGPQITGGLIAYPFAAARDVLRFYRKATASAPDELTLFAGLVTAPDGSGAKLAAIVACHCGPLDEAESALSSIKSFGSPVMDTIAPVGYCEINTILDDSVPRGALNYWKSSLLAELRDEAIDAIIECYASCPSPMGQMLIEHIHGKASRVPVDATAFPHRREGYNFLALSQWASPSDNARCIAWCRETYGSVEPFRADARYMNYMDDDDADEVALAYGPNYQRLREIKGKYDPENVFHLNQNIRPPS